MCIPPRLSLLRHRRRCKASVRKALTLPNRWPRKPYKSCSPPGSTQNSLGSVAVSCILGRQRAHAKQLLARGRPLATRVDVRQHLGQQVRRGENHGTTQGVTDEAYTNLPARRCPSTNSFERAKHNSESPLDSLIQRRMHGRPADAVATDALGLQHRRQSREERIRAIAAARGPAGPDAAVGAGAEHNDANRWNVGLSLAAGDVDLAAVNLDLAIALKRIARWAGAHRGPSVGVVRIGVRVV
mmetsp:Transcript_111335/g.359282  ORF Transcript_111335/g.359282 Transcript_111335/m.359282 type:complete len:242 (+) Transcript_111335:664-1389(+)